MSYMTHVLFSRAIFNAPARSVATSSTIFRRHDYLFRCQSSTISLASGPPPAKATPLEKIVIDSIKSTGPLQVSQYMQLCASHPTEGYYMKKDVFGSRGDFITSPEISQVFGELVGIWFLSQWINAGKPTRTRLVELGPGRGTLMDDMLRALLQFKDFRNSLESIHLVETSAALKTVQEEKLSSYSMETVWHDRIEDIPSGKDPTYTMIIAHEFFDALPIHILQKTEQGFRELLVGLKPNTPTEQLTFVTSPTPTPTSTLLSTSSPRFTNLPSGSRLEVSSASWSVMRSIGELVSSSGGGSALVIDYGDDRVFGNSFRAFRKHNIVDVFDQPGNSDLTANVDFAYLKESISSLGDVATYGPITQKDFLYRLGLEVRLSALIKAAQTEERKRDITSSAKRLVDPTGMGIQYKVLGVVGGGRKGSKKGEVWPFVQL